MLLRVLVLYWSLQSGKVAESTVTPLRYNLTILTHLEGGAQNRYEGIVSIDLEAKKATRYIYLNCRYLNMFVEKTWLLRWASGKRITATDIKKNAKKPNEVTVVINLPLRLGETYTMHIFYTGNLNRPQRYGYFAGHYDQTPQIFWALDFDKVPKTLTVGLLTAVMRTSLGFYVGNQFLVDKMDEFVRR